MRDKTRKERYFAKLAKSTIIPVEVACVNFMCDDNIAYVIRAAACFGIKTINVIGSLPKDVKRLSGSTNELVEIQVFSNVADFKRYADKYDIRLICAELSDDAVEINSVVLPTHNVCYVFGHESLGIPTELLMGNTAVYINMPGPGFCLNTSQAANIFMYEISKTFLRSKIAEQV